MREPFPRATAVIAEHQNLLRDEIRKTPHATSPELAIGGEADDGPAALKALAWHATQIPFLDICMPGRGGLEGAQKAIGKAHVVFIAAFNEPAAAVLGQGALDDVLKSISRERFGLTVRRLKARPCQTPADLRELLGRLHETMAERHRDVQRITVSRGQKLLPITVCEVSFSRADEKYTDPVHIHSEHRINKSLKGLVGDLDPKVFWRINHGVIINANAICSVHRGFRGRIAVWRKQRQEMRPVNAPYTYQFRQM